MKYKVFVLVIVLFGLTGCDYQELNEMSIVTGVAIDKVDGEYELSFLIANSQKSSTSTKEGESQTTVYSGKGSTLSMAAKEIDYKSPKNIYLGHVNVVIVSEEIGKDGFLEVSDFLLRYPESRNEFYLMQAQGCEAGDVLKIVSPLESFPSQSIATLLETNSSNESESAITHYSTFINKILMEGVNPTIPVIGIVGDEEEGKSEENLETTDLEAYLKVDGTAIYRGDEFIDYVSNDESGMINVINDEVNEFNFDFSYKGSSVSFSSDDVETKVSYDGNSFMVVVNGSGYISEINASFDLEDTIVIENMEKSLNKEIKRRLKKVIRRVQEYQSDVFGFGNMIYKDYPDKWDEVKDEWDEVYFPLIKVDISVSMDIESTGSLKQTVKGGNE